MRRTALVVVLLFLLAGAAFGQGRNLRVGYITITQWLQTMRGAPILNLGYYDQTYSSNIRDAFKVNYTGSGHFILNLQGDGTSVFTVDKFGNTNISGAVAAAGGISGTISIPDLDGSHFLTFGWNEDDVADRTLNLKVNGANAQLSLEGTLGAIDQDLTSDGNPHFENLVLADATYPAPWPIVLDVVKTYPNLSSWVYGIRSYLTLNAPSDSSVSSFAVWTTVATTGSVNYTGAIRGDYLQALHWGTGTVSDLRGFDGLASAVSSGDVTSARGVYGRVRHQGSGTITTARGLEGLIWMDHASGDISTEASAVRARINNVAGSITNGYGFYFSDGEGAAPITNLYGLYLEEPTKGATNYAIYSAGGDSYFAGNIGLGVADALYSLHSEKTYSAPASDQYGIFSEVIEDTGVPAPTERRVTAIGGYARYTGAAGHDRLYGIYGHAFNDSATTLNKVYATTGTAYNTSSGTIASAVGTFGWTRNTGSGTITGAWGAGGNVRNESTGTIDNAYGLEAAITNTDAGGTIDKAYGLIMYDWSNAGTVNESYGIYMDTSIDVGTLRYALYSSSLSDSYFAGKFGLGTITPDTRLELSEDAASTTLTVSSYHDVEATTPILTFRKADGDEATPAPVDENAILGTINFEGRDNDSFEPGARIYAKADANWGAAERGADIFFATRDGAGALTDQFKITADGNFNSVTSKWYYCKYIDAINAAAGGSGAVQTVPTANTLGGYQLDVNTEYLYFNSRTCPNWDEASDPMVAVTFEVNVDNSGGLVTDTVDFSLLCYYKGEGETVNKTQTATVSVVVGQSVQFKQFTDTLMIDHDIGGGNDVDVRDIFTFRINLDTAASEVDNVIVNFFMYHQQGFKVQMQTSEAP